MRSFLSIGVLFLTCVLGAGSALGGVPDADSWEIDGEHSTVGFRIRHIVGFVPGVFARFSGEVEYAPAAPEKSQFYILIDSASVHTGVPARDEHLRGPDFLDVEKSPRIIFASKSVSKGEGNVLYVTGDLTIKDVTAEIRVPVKVLGVAAHPFKDNFPDTKVLGLHAQFSINRLDFHVGEAKWTQMGVMGETIDLTIDMELLQR
ncbi:YceI family protein [Desulfomicrobium escambiense]|uniref:YceI family protein n=1 Tax=Desulfomicrobium escambiense TaxID=29503 RepID=UPI000427DC5E|nr:YceI family protein [Desulfomicrobium escambiense]